MNNWKSLRLDEGTPLSVLLDRLPPLPGLYCIKLNLLNDSSPCSLESVSEKVNKSFGLPRKTSIGFYESVQLEHKLNVKPSYATDSVYKKLNAKEGFGTKFEKMMLLAETLSPVLYVGETNDIQRRLKEHLMDSSELISRFHSAGISASDLLINWVVIEEGFDCPVETVENAVNPLDTWATIEAPKEKVDKSELLFFEELLTQICKPRFIEKIGENKDKE